MSEFFGGRFGCVLRTAYTTLTQYAVRSTQSYDGPVSLETHPDECDAGRFRQMVVKYLPAIFLLSAKPNKNFRHFAIFGISLIFCTKISYHIKQKNNN